MNDVLKITIHRSEDGSYVVFEEDGKGLLNGRKWAFSDGKDLIAFMRQWAQ